jgi:hypothetical protein
VVKCSIAASCFEEAFLVTKTLLAFLNINS